MEGEVGIMSMDSNYMHYTMSILVVVKGEG